MYEIIISCKKCRKKSMGYYEYKACPLCGSQKIEQQPILTIDEAAALKSTSRNTICDWTNRNKINHEKIEGKNFIIHDDTFKKIFPKRGPKGKKSFLEKEIEKLQEIIDQHEERINKLEKLISP